MLLATWLRYLTATAMSGPFFICLNDTTTTEIYTLSLHDALPISITLTVTVAGNAGSPLINSVTVSGGGENNTANDTAAKSPTLIPPTLMTLITSHAWNFAQGQVGAQYTITVSDVGVSPVVVGSAV